MASLELDKDDDTVEVLSLRFPAGTIVATLGTADHVLAQLQQQISDIERRLILQKYVHLPVAQLKKADAAAQLELAKEQ